MEGLSKEDKQNSCAKKVFKLNAVFKVKPMTRSKEHNRTIAAYEFLYV